MVIPFSQRAKTIVELGIPIALGMLSQSVLSLVDIGMVSTLNDPNALAAVGIGGYSSFLAVALLLGLSVGIQAVVARRYGEGKHDAIMAPLNAGITLALIIGGALTLFFLLTGNTLIGLITQDIAVSTIANEYFDYRTLGICLLGINYTYRGFYNGLKQSVLYLKILVVTHVTNAFFTYCFIYGAFGFTELGAAGSGLGTTLALLIGTLLYTLVTLRKYPREQFLRRLPSKSTTQNILKLATPNSIQHFSVALFMSSIYALLARIGVNELAVAHTIININLFIVLPGTGISLAATTLVASAMGSQQFSEAHRWGWDTVKITAPLLALLGLPLLLWPEAILSIFLTAQPELIALGKPALQITGLSAALHGVTLALMQALYGAGANKTVFKYTLAVQWLFTLPLSYIVGIYLDYGLIGVWLIQAFDKIVSIVIFSLLWQRRRWQTNTF